MRESQATKQLCDVLPKHMLSVYACSKWLTGVCGRCRDIFTQVEERVALCCVASSSGPLCVSVDIKR